MRTALTWMLGLGWLASGLGHGAENKQPDVRTTNLAAISQWHAICVDKYGQDPNVMLRPRLMANRKTQRVEFFAEATGIRPRETMEFFMIGEESGNAYEALAISLAQPLDVYEAMIFIGMRPGRGVDYEKLQFWPKGERVVMAIDGKRAETLMTNDDTGKPLDPVGLVFIGSHFIPAETEDAAPALAAQIRAPYAIAANYNEPDAIFDVPYSAPQTAVYSKQSLNPKYEFAPGTRLKVVIEPEYKDGKLRVKDLQLTVGRGSNTVPSLVTATLALREDGTNTEQTLALPELLKRFSDMIDNGYDPFLKLRFDDNVSIGQLHELAKLLRAIDGDSGVRVEPPVPGQLYYKAFAPNEEYREREGRFLQPWELRLTASGDGVVTGVLTEITEIWTQGEPKPEIETEDYVVTSPEAAVSLLTTRKPDVKVLLVYAPPSLTHGELMAYVSPAYATHPIVHVYIEKQEENRRE